jgi:hypothetical protein
MKRKKVDQFNYYYECNDNQVNGKTKYMTFITNIVVHVLNNRRLFVNRDADSYSSKNKMYIN